MRSLLGLLKYWCLGCLVCLLMLGCAGMKKGPPVAETVVLPVSKFITLDEKLTAPCGPKATGPLSEILEVAALRGIQVDDCDKRMAEIRALQPKVEAED